MAVSLDQFGRDVARRLEAEADTKVARNSGNRRTASKQALLKAIAATGAHW